MHYQRKRAEENCLLLRLINHKTFKVLPIITFIVSSIMEYNEYQAFYKEKHGQEWCH